MPSAPICILSDLTLSLPLYSPHNFAPAPPVPPVPPPMVAVPMAPAPASSIELPMNMLWPPGNALFKNKYSTTVVHKFLGIIQAGHDIGILIPHVQVAPAPDNFFTPIQILFSSRKVAFSSTSVMINGAFVAFAGVIALPPTPMMVCADPVSFPLGEVPTRWTNTVHAGISWADLAIGYLAAAAAMAFELLLFKRLGMGNLKGITKASRKGLAEAIYKKMFPVQTLKAASAAVQKQAMGMLIGVLSGMAQGTGLSYSATIGSSFASVSLTAGVDAAGNVGASVSTKVPTLGMTVGAKTGEGVSAQAQANWGSGGGTATQGGKKPGVATHNTVGGETTAESSQ